MGRFRASTWIHGLCGDWADIRAMSLARDMTVLLWAQNAKASFWRASEQQKSLKRRDEISSLASSSQLCELLHVSLPHRQAQKGTDAGRRATLLPSERKSMVWTPGRPSGQRKARTNTGPWVGHMKIMLVSLGRMDKKKMEWDFACFCSLYCLNIYSQRGPDRGDSKTLFCPSSSASRGSHSTSINNQSSKCIQTRLLPKEESPGPCGHAWHHDLRGFWDAKNVAFRTRSDPSFGGCDPSSSSQCPLALSQEMMRRPPCGLTTPSRQRNGIWSL